MSNHRYCESVATTLRQQNKHHIPIVERLPKGLQPTQRIGTKIRRTRTTQHSWLGLLTIKALFNMLLPLNRYEKSIQSTLWTPRP